MTNEENEPIITPIELRELLKLRGITTTLTDTDLEKLIEYKTTELCGLIGTNIYPTLYTDLIRDFNDDKILVINYPIHEVKSITLSDNSIDLTNVTVDYENGIIYFDTNKVGKLQVEYTSCLSEHLISIIFYPLLIDFIEQGLPELRARQGATSIKEGDMSINYNVNDTLSAKIETRIAALKNYNTRIRML